MQKAHRIRKNGQFRYVYKKGKGAAQKRVSLNYVKANRLQAGFSVSKKVGKAVVRNRVKRRLRECFRLQMASLPKGLYVFTARPEAATASYHELAADMSRLLKRLQLTEQKP